MNIENTMDNNNFNIISNLISKKKYSDAEKLLNKSTNKDATYHYLYSLILEKKAWFDGALSHLETALSMEADNALFKNRLISLMGRHRRYSDDYYNHGYRRRNRGCACCCCDDCCECGNFSCCDLICLDQCCECMGGDLIDCI